MFNEQNPNNADFAASVELKLKLDLVTLVVVAVEANETMKVADEKCGKDLTNRALIVVVVLDTLEVRTE